MKLSICCYSKIHIPPNTMTLGFLSALKKNRETIKLSFNARSFELSGWILQNCSMNKTFEI